MKKEIEEWLESFGEDAKRAYREGGAWEWRPEDASFLDAWVSWAYSTPIIVYIGPGYEISGGHIFENIWECSTDGEWEFLEACEVTDPQYERWKKDFGEEEREKSWRLYWEYVIENGEEPLGELMGEPTGDALLWEARVALSDIILNYCWTKVEQCRLLYWAAQRGKDKNDWLVLSDWLEEQGDKRAGELREVWA